MLPPRRCELLLRLLDALGKWSLLDFDMLMMMAAAFHLHWVVPAPAGADGVEAAGAPPPLEAWLEVTPLFGMHGFLAACCLSLGTSHVLLALQRRATAVTADAAARSSGAATAAAEQSAGTLAAAVRAPSRLAVRSYRFERPWGGHGSRSGRGPRRLAWRAQAAMVALLGVCGLTVLGGAAARSFSIRIGGLAGTLLGAEASATSYSLLSLGLALPGTSSRAGAATLPAFQAVFFIVCLAAPLLWLLLLALLWLVPLRATTQRRLFVAAEVAHAWAALDVFLVTLLASLLELDQFSQFIVGDECDALNALLRRYFGALVHGEPQCFRVDAQLEPGAWLLFAASAVSMATGYLVMHGGRRALKDHERRCARTARRFPTAAAAGLTPLSATSGGDPIPLGVVNAASTGDASFRRGARAEL